DVNAALAIDGGPNAAEVTFQDAGSAGAHTYKFEAAPAGFDVRVSREAPLKAFDLKGVSKYTLNAGKGVDTIRVEVAPAAATDGVYINGNAGRDLIHVGAEAGAGMTEVKAPVFVDGGADSAELSYHDAGGPAVDHHYTF